MPNFTERIGINHCGEIAEKMNWMFREQPVNDVGIDAHMELVDSTGKCKQLLALQIKSGESWFKERNRDRIIFRDINERQYFYWTTNSLPCIVVLYNPIDNTCIWQKLTDETIKKTKGGTGKGFYVEVPLKQIFLNDLSNKQLLFFTNLPELVLNYNFLLSQKEFMQIIKDGGEVKLHSSEWVNKGSGKGEIELIVNEGNTNQVFSYPYWFPFTSYTEVFPKLFPWADFTVDQEFYEEYDFSLWQELNCYYDKEDKDWIVVGDSFKAFREKLAPIRSVDRSGEVAEYMLLLSLNDLGESFLKVNEFVTQNQVYVETRPKEK